ncbi:beta-glucosidase [Echinicola sp. CAU 1574]|uniref:Beta-glucosidase n=1 Tax=Echinicola arenosa TaxID=2774144 RepID=A0ABR9AGR7_9BACT|nr:glucoamylase family protein [Echinicola arenosa]MBD8487446.1 beta-glucosidase [Echinicola arenosa]
MNKKQLPFYLTFFLSIILWGCAEEDSASESPILAKGYDRHVELHWPKTDGINDYEVWVSTENNSFSKRTTVQDTMYMDFVNDLGNNLTLKYKIVGLNEQGENLEIGTTQANTMDFSDEELINMVEYYTFRYFWQGAEPTSGMGPERIHIDGDYPQNDQSVVTTGGTGFGIFGIIAAMDRGWITKEQGVARFDKMVSFLENADRFHGVWPHWIYGETGKARSFSDKDNGGDLVESAFLMQGLLAVREYFKNGNENEKNLANRIDHLWKTMEWDWYTQGGHDVLYWHWSPTHEWEMDFPLEGYNECLITYILAASSPTHSIPASAYHKGWARSGGINTDVEAYGYPLHLKHNGSEAMGGPLFWAHYSYLGLNPKGLTDQYANYWEENKNHTLINRAWCVENPNDYKGYGKDLWGLTASYTTTGYAAHRPGGDLGVISPTAALSSIPYTPEESLNVIKNLYYNYGEKVFGRYGFYDALSPENDYYPKRYLAIDQGPIVAMIENYRSGLGWKLFMGAPEIQEGLKKLGFESNP